ncbi:MAG TPA: serine hydrolase [Candidatus Udaeobacter sp.]|nr:serine hydrolase [Candidatus Udaeobacter sp.]
MNTRSHPQSAHLNQSRLFGLVLYIVAMMAPLIVLAGQSSETAGLSAHSLHRLQTQLARFKQFPGTTSVRIDIGDDTVASDTASTQLFVASAIKTLIVCQYLRDVEDERLSEDEQLPVNDNVRTDGSSVLLNLTGTTTGRSILEAAITHSDNTATDIALRRVGPDRVRSFIAAAGLNATLIPDSTRRFFSYNVGAPLGVDIGWSGVQQVLRSRQLLGPPRQPLNNRETLASTADDLVSYYKRALAGAFFTKPETLAEFKRIHLSNTFFPDDTVGYGKGGSGDWVADVSNVADFHALSYAGQMVVGKIPVTFCFVVNWKSVDPNRDSTALTPAFVSVVKGCMEATKRGLLHRPARNRIQLQDRFDFGLSGLKSPR